MGTDVIPYDPYHPHLAYTLVVACIAWVGVTLYSRWFLQHLPRLRVQLYALVIGLPLFGEGFAYLINLVRPAPETRLGYILTHFHAYYLQRLPIDSFLSPSAEEILILMLGGLATISLVRFLIGTRRLERALSTAAPLAETSYTSVMNRLLSVVNPHYGALPPIYVCNLSVQLAFTTGIARQRIYASSALLDALTTDEAVAVLCHEWAHVQRRDILWNTAVRLLRDVLWFLPSSHTAWHAMAASQDEACDALAARMTRQPLVLARALVKVASSKQNNTLPSLSTANMFARAGHTPRTRVEQMIRLSQPSGRSGRASVIGAGLLGMLLLVASMLPALLGS
ncbi:hypothetical protein SE17_06080 [Kouleothrix aurantiaca]|uniref:Peptidase M56 domain-containing protein n=1 Tax=Kouleothrix aurantiaca TaxID=186479 RepID=A0A0P9HGU0_9CHLR|nr:hypothetical protein SE17_06080 [Kouleothrix aurantiaca]